MVDDNVSRKNLMPFPWGTSEQVPFAVIPAKAGIQAFQGVVWMPAFAGMTSLVRTT
jgi:hypothetical protein